MWKTNLIQLYCAVCEHNSTIENLAQRLSNNFRPKFTDAECITVYLWGLSRSLFQQKAIWQYTKDHLSEWFPDLPSYQAFNRRLNFLAPVLTCLSESWMDMVSAAAEDEGDYAVDSCPVMLAVRSRSSNAKVAPEICSKSYNSTRKEWYYGVKLHAFVSKHYGKLPTPCALISSTASAHDLPVAKQIMESCKPFSGGTLYADKAYCDAIWEKELASNYSVILRTPKKKKRGEMAQHIDTYSSWISSARQPVESFFSWLNAKTNIQSASKVRSLSGLLTHIFGRIAVAMYGILFNP